MGMIWNKLWIKVITDKQNVDNSTCNRCQAKPPQDVFISVLLGILGRRSGWVEEPWIYVQEGVIRMWLRINKASLPCGCMAHLAESGLCYRAMYQMQAGSEDHTAFLKNPDYKSANIRMYSLLPLPPNGFLVWRLWLLETKTLLFCVSDIVQRRERPGQST